MNSVQISSVILFVLTIQCSNGMPRFANYIQDHMVLQRAPQRAVVWGYGDPSALTTLTINNKIYTTISQSELTNAQNESIWSVTLDPVSDEGPFDIHVSQPLTNGTLVTITLHDILFGDVWLCSGQSNMQLTVSMIYNATEEIQNAGNYPKIRVFTAALRESATPIEELIDTVLNWSLASPQSIGGRDWQHMSAVCWLYGRMIHQALNGRPIGLISTCWVGTSIQVWMPPKALQDCNTTTLDLNMKKPSSNEPTIYIPGNHTYLFNAMIHPFTRMVIYGVIWYQGEGNTGAWNDIYSCLFAKMIENWREIWNQRTNGLTDIQFPFGFVQLSTETNSSTFVGGKPWIRWHQTFGIGYVPNNVVPKMFMAVALDLRDDPHGVHPRYKHDVGYRLSRSGLAVAYGQQIEFQGPIVQNVTYVNGSQTLNLTYTAVSGIDVRNTNGFEVCCLEKRKCLNDDIWVPANITNKTNLTVTLTIDKSCVGQDLYGIRYLWRETPCPFKQAAIYSSTDPNLPSPPYLKVFRPL